MLELSRLRIGNLNIEQKLINLEQCISEVTDSFRNEAKFKKIGIVTKIDPDLSEVQVMSDPQKLKLIMYNLMSNSIKFVNGGRVIVKTKLLGYSHTISKINSYSDQIIIPQAKEALKAFKQELSMNFQSKNINEQQI